MIVISSVEADRRKRRKEVKDTIRKEARTKRIVMRAGLVVVGDVRLRFAVDDNGCIPI